MVHPDVHPAAVAGHIVDPEGDRHLSLWSHEEEAVVLHPDRLARQPPDAARTGQHPDVLLLLRIHADHRLSVSLMCLGLLVDVPELRIPVRMLFPLQGLGVGLQAKPALSQQPAHRRRGDRMPLTGQFLGQIPQ